MSDLPITDAIVTGHYSAGKGPVARMLQAWISQNHPTLDCQFIRDRELLEIEVLADTERRHSTINRLGPPLQFDVKDGSLHNIVHRSMIQGIHQTPSGIFQIREIATGPDAVDFGLYQSGDHLIELIEEYDVLSRTLIIDVFASKETRFARNLKREDSVSQFIMEAAAGDGGELSRVAQRLGSHYYFFDNDQDGDLEPRVFDAYQKFVRPHLEGTFRNLEGGGKPFGFDK